MNETADEKPRPNIVIKMEGPMLSHGAIRQMAAEINGARPKLPRWKRLKKAWRA